MARKKENKYQNFLQGKTIPLLTLDNRWHQLFPDGRKTAAMKRTEKELNSLIQRQGQLGNDLKDMKKLKKTLMKEIVDNMEAATTNDNELLKKQSKNQKLIMEINEKTPQMKDELDGLPARIEQVNQELMLLSMEVCYEKLKANDDAIIEMTEWITKTREELKETLVKREELQEYNSSMYGYMHNLLGPEIADIFDIKYKTFQIEQPKLPK